nr:MAG TPA: hypothetical protein [Caudoviricetes sp.]
MLASIKKCYFLSFAHEVNSNKIIKKEPLAPY